MGFVNIENFVLAGLAITVLHSQNTERFPMVWFNRFTDDVPQLDSFDFLKTNSCVLCPRFYYPVCGSDNFTYTNECKLHCLNVVRKKDPQVNMTRTGPCFIFPD